MRLSVFDGRGVPSVLDVRMTAKRSKQSKPQGAKERLVPAVSPASNYRVEQIPGSEGSGRLAGEPSRRVRRGRIRPVNCRLRLHLNLGNNGGAYCTVLVRLGR